MAVKRDALDLIGDTPAVDVSQLSPNPDVRLVAKLESANPTGSVKDRIAKAMVLDAEADGTLAPGKRILEAVLGQHRHSPGHDRPAAGLSDHGGDA